MFVAVSPSEPTSRRDLGAIRARGAVRLAVAAETGRTRITTHAETGGYRARFPRRTDATLDAILLNTGGGMAGGDAVEHHVTVGAGAALAVTSLAAEKIYRSADDASRVTARLDVGEGASFVWLPQETILFDGARLERSLTVEAAATARVLLAEILVFGRTAMGETVRVGLLADRWRLHVGGALVHAEELRLEGDVAAALASPSVGRGYPVAASLVCLSPAAHASLAAVRDLLPAGGDALAAAASAWGGRLVVRMLADRVEPVRALTARLAAVLTGREIARIWWS